MINLLPDETKKSIRAARTNTALVRYIIFTGFAIVFLALACTTSYLILDNSKTAAENAVTNIKTKNSSYSPVTNQANELISNLAIAKNILNQQISYSTIITGIAAVLPSGVVLEAPLTLTNDTIGAPMTLKAHARTSSDETTLKANFQQSPLFSGYNLQSLTNNLAGSTDYPFLISFSITINKAAAK
jgi:Tfp pilus assembly protein PilN